MYEIRQKQKKEMMEHKLFNYVLLAAAIFVFSQSSSGIKNNTGYSIAGIILSFIMHTRSVENLTERIFKIKKSTYANVIMLATLSITSVICYFVNLNIIYIVLLNLASIALYIVSAAIFSKSKKEKVNK